MDDSLFDGLPQSVEEIVKKHDIGGFNTMPDDEIKQLMESEQYESLKAADSENLPAVNHLGKTVAEILGLTSVGKQLPRQWFNCIKSDSISVDSFNDIVSSSPVLDDIALEGEVIYPPFRHLMEDIFLSVVKHNVELRNPYEIHKSVLSNMQLIKMFVNTPQYIKLHDKCRYNEFNSAIATKIISEKFVSFLTDLMKNKQEEMKKLQELMEQDELIDNIMNANDAMYAEAYDSAKNGQPYNEKALKAMIAENVQAIAQQQKESDRIYEQMDEIIDPNNDELKDEIVSMSSYQAEASSFEINEMLHILTGYGLNEGTIERIGFEGCRKFAEEVRRSPDLMKYIDMIGRLRETMIEEQNKKSKTGAVEINSVTTGNEIQSVLPTSLAMLSNPTAKKEFYSEYSEKRLLQYSKVSSKNKNKGPIIVCIDISGSMKGDKHAWSKAIAAVMLEVAQRQKRAFCAILYDSIVQETVIIEKNEISPEKILKICETFTNGGTRFDPPLNEIINVIQKYKILREADVEFITDGQSDVSTNVMSKFKNAKEKYEFTCRGLVLNIGRGSVSDSTLHKFCDSVDTISDVAQLKQADSELNRSIFAAL